MEKILSLIIPTYNMEKYLNKCLDSLIVENINLIEVLVINDGSKDRSSEIAHKYENKYPNTFRVIDKENGNYGSCINRGLKEAKGKYIKILDADDYFDINNLNNFINYLETIDVDLIITDYNNVNSYNEITKHISFNLNPYKILSFKEVYNIQEFKDIQMHAVTYNKKHISSLNYKQTEGISYTDREWTFLPISKVNTISYYNKTIYNYLLGREGQTMDPNITRKQISQTITIIYNKLNIYHNIDYKTQEIDIYLSYRLMRRIKNIYSDLLLHTPIKNKKDILNFDSTLKDKYPKFYMKAQDECIYRNFKFVKLWREAPILFMIWVYTFIIVRKLYSIIKH